MMPTKSSPNTRDTNLNKTRSPCNYEQPELGYSSANRDADSPPPAPPVRDSSSLKYIKYGPGHEKYPSWPVPAAAEIPESLRTQNSGGSHRSKSWTDHTDYPKEKVVTYTRPYMKRQHSSLQKKLKTVMEKCEKIPPEAYAAIKDRLYLPRVDREGKPLGDTEYMVPSPPERDHNKPHLTQADLEKYVRSYEDHHFPKTHLTQSELEEYSRAYQHQKQPSYAQSEGYHSYVSSTDSTSTPFLDRLRRDSEAAVISANNRQGGWEETAGRDSVVTNSSGSASSSETLKWHGSLSDVSVASSSCTNPANLSRQLIVHSAKVQTPQKHNSESVLYIGSEKKNWKVQEKRNKLKLFAVNTYAVQPSVLQQEQNERLTTLSPQALSVADRVNVLEMQQKYSYLDPDKRHKIPDPTLKAIQKKALLSFYERQTNNNSWRSEPHLSRSQPPTLPQPPPRYKPQPPSRRASCASDYASANTSRRSSFSSPRDKLIRHQHSNSCGSLSADLLGPVIVGPSISIDDWVKPPERPPKNPQLRDMFRLPSPDLPPPSPPTVLEDEVFNSDEPLPPPPPELQVKQYAEPQKPATRVSYRAEPLRVDEVRFNQRASIAESPSREALPPPLQPRQMRVNQSMRVRMPSEKRSFGGMKLSPKGDLGADLDGKLFNLSMSQSKASYLQTRRDRERIPPDLDTGVYKRTMSPNGHTIPPDPLPDPSKLRDTKWPAVNRTNSDNILLRRVSMTEKSKNGTCDSKKPLLLLPDVLPVKEKILPHRSQFAIRSISLDSEKSSPFSPLRHAGLSSPLKPAPTIEPLRCSPMISISTNTSSSPPSSPKEPVVLEGLQMVQRTEVILRVNVSTTDAASQTEKNDEEEGVVTPVLGRRVLQEEIECEKLSQDLVKQLSPSDRLKDLLVPDPDHKKPTDYVTGLFKPEVTSRPRPTNSPFRSRTTTPTCSPPPSSQPTSPLSPTSVYFLTSEPKAKFLTRYKDMSHYNFDTKDLTQKKMELVSRLDRKLEVLRSEQVVITEECRVNNELGENVDSHVNRVARPHEAAKLRLHVEEVGKITSLLLGLSGRLARAENALLGTPEDHPELGIMESKRDKLRDQLDEAKKLKENIDRRSTNVSNILHQYLNDEEYADYDHFINMKAKLIVDAREISDKIKLGEEQITALKETLSIN